jgi:hypothetical protein
MRSLAASRRTTRATLDGSLFSRPHRGSSALITAPTEGSQFVRIPPGSSAQTLTPKGATSWVRDLVNPPRSWRRRGSRALARRRSPHASTPSAILRPKPLALPVTNAGYQEAAREGRADAKPGSEYEPYSRWYLLLHLLSPNPAGFVEAQPSPATLGRQTPGGLVSNCYIDGKIMKDPGDLDGDGIAVIPVKILAPV